MAHLKAVIGGYEAHLGFFGSFFLFYVEKIINILFFRAIACFLLFFLGVFKPVGIGAATWSQERSFLREAGALTGDLSAGIRYFDRYFYSA